MKEGTKQSEQFFFKAMELLERILSRVNMRRAYEQVMHNKGSGGVDGIELPGFKAEVEQQWPSIRQKIREGQYEPKPVRRVEIPKSGGGIRMLGIPTLMDRMIQQATGQVLMEEYDRGFSRSSYGFRPGCNAQQAIVQAKAFVNAGYRYVVDIDLEKFFDRVNHDYLMNLLSERIKDKGVLKLIHRYLKAGAMEEGIARVNREGTPQGGPRAPRTHPQTLRFPGDFPSNGEDFNYCYIKSSIFMVHGTITEFRVNQANQSNLQFIEEGDTAFPDCQSVDGDVWNLPDSGISLHTEGSGESGKGSHSGGYSGVHCKTSSQLDQKDQKICAFQGAVHQQSGANCAGRVPVKEGSWQKRRDKLKWRIATTVCGSKSFLRSPSPCPISRYQYYLS